MSNDPNRRRRTPWFLILVLTVLATSAAGYLIGSQVRSPQEALASAEPPKASILTAPVRRGTLRDSAQFPGAVEWRSTLTVKAPLFGGGGIPVVTATPLAAGSQVEAGNVLLEVSDRPVIALPGAIPMLRDLHLGDIGPDVARLQLGLGSAGVFSGAADGVYGESTQQALRTLYESAHHTLPGVARDRVGQRDPKPREGYASAAEIVFVPVLPATMLGGPVIGANVDGELAKLGIGGRVVRVDVPVSWRQWLRPGSPHPARIRLQMPKGPARSARIEELGPDRQVEGEGERMSVTLATGDSGLGPESVGTKVRVTLSDTSAPSGLLVPLSALYTSAESGSFIRVQRDGKQANVRVRVKGTSKGTAVVSPRAGDDLTVGDRVVVGVDASDD